MGRSVQGTTLTGVTRRSLAIDAGVAALVFGLSLGVLASGGLGIPDPHAHTLDGLGTLLVAACALPLVARRRAPLTVYLVTGVASIVLVGRDYPVDFPFGPVVALYGLAVAYSGDPRPIRRRTALLAAVLFVPVAATVHTATTPGVRGILSGLAFWALMCAAAWISGEHTRLRRERIGELEEHAGRVERETERERRLAAAEERTRIARELHDFAGHAINVILVQAGAARLLHERDPARSRLAISTIEEVARSTIGEIDGLVRALREDTGTGLPVPADPAALDELLARHRAGGLALVSDVRGTDRGLPRGVAWAAYRILQEALTNAARHGPGSAEVAVSFEPDAVAITVTNPIMTGAASNGGNSGTAPGGGHGIVGMRERATLLGGTFQARTEYGVFRLHALLPHMKARP
jgi:signal transduction histidine kinase